MAPADGERRRGLDGALSRAQRALPPVELRGAELDDRPLRGVGHPRRVDDRRLATRLRRARAVLRRRRAGDRGGRAGRQRRREPSDPAGSAFEGARARGYPMPPLRRSGWTELTDRGARGLGWHPFPAPAAINSVPYNGNPSCTYCGFCAGNGCYRDAKGSTDTTVIRRAEATGLLRIETGARVTRIATDGDGLVTGAAYVQDGRAQFCPARAVLLATFTYENMRLLLLSSSPAHPRGLGNRHDQVGRHYMAHVTPFAFGSFPGRRLNLFTGLWAQATCVDDWNADNFDHSGLGFIGGGLLVAPHELRPIQFASSPLPPSVPRFGSGWKAWLSANAQSVGGASAQMECLPYEGNRLDLDPRVRDPSRHPGGPRDAPGARERAARGRVPGRAARAVASRGRRRRGLARAPPARGGAPFLWRHAHGRRPGELGRRSIRLRATTPATSACSARPSTRRRGAIIRPSRCRRSRGARRSTWSSTGARSSLPRVRPAANMKSDIFALSVYRERGSG